MYFFTYIFDICELVTFQYMANHFDHIFECGILKIHLQTRLPSQSFFFQVILGGYEKGLGFLNVCFLCCCPLSIFEDQFEARTLNTSYK